MSSTTKNLYLQREQKFKSTLKKLEEKDTRIAMFRGVVFIALLTLVIMFIKSSWILGVAIPIVLLFVFLQLVQNSSRLKVKILHLKNLIQINQHEILALEGDHSPFKQGDEFIDYNHPYSYDLDVFGPYSLYNLLDRTGTVPGKHQLANELKAPNLDREMILNRQQAVQELTNELDWRQDFLATARQIEFEKDETLELQRWLKGKDHFSTNRWYPILFLLVPLIGVVLPILVGLNQLSVYFILWYLAPLVLVAVQSKRILREQNRLGRFVKLFKKYAGLLALVEQHEFVSDHLQEEQDRLEHHGQKASKIVDRLSGILWGLESRNNLIMAFLLNAFALWDLRYMVRLEHWRRQFGSAFEVWIQVIARVEVLNSLANLAFNRKDLNFPVVSGESVLIEMEEVGHPIIDPKQRVDNSISFKGPGQIKIVTGANMAGKSTLLRTVGINLLLGVLGAPICAKKCTFTPLRMRTSVRTNDSLGDNASYFYAELVKLGNIMQDLQENGPLFVIVDEMLKGTNSKDKHSGSVGLVKKLIGLGAVGLVATHDIELGKLKQQYPDQIENLRFEVEIKEEQLSFDYKLQEGISQNLNATFLMKRMGIIDD